MKNLTKEAQAYLEAGGDRRDVCPSCGGIGMYVRIRLYWVSVVNADSRTATCRRSEVNRNGQGML